MTEREKMLAGELYDCGDPELLAQWHLAKNLIREYNGLLSENLEEKDRILNRLLGSRGDNLWITAPFYVDYGNNIYFGNNCEVNMNCTFLDDNRIEIGDNALIAPNVQIYTAFHPTNAADRFGPLKEDGSFSFCKTRTALIHKPAEQLQVMLPESLFRLYGPLVLIDRMACTPDMHRVFDDLLDLLESLLRQFAQ